MKELEALAAAVQKMQADRSDGDAKRQAAFETMLSGIETALSDLVRVIEERPDTIGDLVAAIKAFKMPAGQSTPTIEVNPAKVTVENKIDVKPTPVTITNQVPHAAPPNVSVHSALPVGAVLRIEQPGFNGGPARVSIVTRTA